MGALTKVITGVFSLGEEEEEAGLVKYNTQATQPSVGARADAWNRSLPSFFLNFGVKCYELMTCKEQNEEN